MSAYLRSWLGGSSSSSASSQPRDALPPPSEQKLKPEVSLEVTEPDDADSDGDSDLTETDAPPAFPALNSAQRLGSSSSTAATLPSSKQSNSNGASTLPKALMDTLLMPPPPLPGSALRVPGVPTSTSRVGSNNSSLGVPSMSSSLMPPPTMNGAGSGNTLGVPPTTTKRPKKAREKVALAPGFGPLDWAALKSSGADLRGVDTLLRVTPSMLKQHNKKDDAWSAIFGKVYNITPYLPFHPGGEKELMRVAGRDGTKLFASTHAWVNAEFMLDACLVGFLVSEGYGS